MCTDAATRLYAVVVPDTWFISVVVVAVANITILPSAYTLYFEFPNCFSWSGQLTWH